jgi:hypothetical protein
MPEAVIVAGDMRWRRQVFRHGHRPSRALPGNSALSS